MYPLKEIYVTTPFGKKGSVWAAGQHTGTDFRAAVGTHVYATKGGKVVEANNSGRYGSDYGNHVVIQCRSRWGRRQALYAHLSSIRVRYGAKVTTGQLVGLSGDTGNTFGPHLHYEERRSPFTYWDFAAPVLLKYHPKPFIRLSKVKPGKTNRHVKKMQRHLNRHLHGSNVRPNGRFGRSTRDEYSRWQRKLGYSGKAANGIPGRTSLKKLGFRVLP